MKEEFQMLLKRVAVIAGSVLAAAALASPASAAVAARAWEPSFATRSARVSGPREFDTTTS